MITSILYEQVILITHDCKKGEIDNSAAEFFLRLCQYEVEIKLDPANDSLINEYNEFKKNILNTLTDGMDKLLENNSDSKEISTITNFKIDINISKDTDSLAQVLENIKIFLDNR